MAHREPVAAAAGFDLEVAQALQHRGGGEGVGQRLRADVPGEEGRVAQEGTRVDAAVGGQCQVILAAPHICRPSARRLSGARAKNESPVRISSWSPRNAERRVSCSRVSR